MLYYIGYVRRGTQSTELLLFLEVVWIDGCVVHTFYLEHDADEWKVRGCNRVYRALVERSLLNASPVESDRLFVYERCLARLEGEIEVVVTNDVR